MTPDGLPEDLREVLELLDRGVSDLYGGRYRGMVLFGSYARGEARGKESDVDPLVLLEGEVESSWREYLKIEPISWPSLWSPVTCCRSSPSTWSRTKNREGRSS